MADIPDDASCLHDALFIKLHSSLAVLPRNLIFHEIHIQQGRGHRRPKLGSLFYFSLSTTRQRAVDEFYLPITDFQHDFGQHDFRPARLPVC